MHARVSDWTLSIIVINPTERKKVIFQTHLFVCPPLQLSWPILSPFQKEFVLDAAATA